MSRFVYADNAATSRIIPEVVESMTPYLEKNFGNPSSIYSIGKEAKEAVEKSRKIIAECINADPDEIFFTSSGTESDNWAIKSSYSSGKHIISSKIEHHAVLKSLSYLERQGAHISYLSPDKFGIISPESLEKEISSNTNFVSIMTANNEIGTIQPIEELVQVCKYHKIKFHTDAVQAIGHIKIDVKLLGIDMLSASAHKFNGPKGIGFLYIRKGIPLQSFIHGGSQERNRRAGTENVPYIVGMAKALEIASNNMYSNRSHLISLQNRLIENILKIPESILTGHPSKRIPGTASFCFKGIEGESLLLNLDFCGICASSGSACTSGSLDPSHVLLAIGLPHEIAHGSLRISLGHDNSVDDVDYIISVLPPIVEKLRQMSPLW